MMQFLSHEGNKTQGMLPSLPKNRILCPYIRRPFDACYCTSTSSLYAEATIHYCGGNFEKCEIYEKNKGSGEKE